MCVFFDLMNLMNLNLHPATCSITAKWMETSTQQSTLASKQINLSFFIVSYYFYPLDFSRLYVGRELVSHSILSQSVSKSVSRSVGQSVSQSVSQSACHSVSQSVSSVSQSVGQSFSQ